jgi:hypothetical protein
VAEAAPPPGEATSLMEVRFFATPHLIASWGLLARALGPDKAGGRAGGGRSAGRRARVSGTGLTMYLPPELEGVSHGEPRFLDTLSRAAELFKPDRRRVAEEVRGELEPASSLKRWLSSGAGEEVARERAPVLACLVCVTRRPGRIPEIEIAGSSGAAWFDRSATQALESAGVEGVPDRDDLEAARGCYHFAARVWRQRPDLTNFAAPFRLEMNTIVRLITLAKLKT